MANRYQPLKDYMGLQLVHEILSAEDVVPCLHQYVSRVTSALVYGGQSPKETEMTIKTIDSVIRAIMDGITSPSNFIVDAFPVLDYLSRCCGSRERIKFIATQKAS
ncbi:hypothetical protein ASPWEDRAFT_41050 [Aspergillus wentii DTO 134E9]|uniref:Uncharacterized protein n=1 Tax=Aspergillus wentii DTO 134E9 TaxID=1073089 RepID=A0A1L9RLU7_ASPWE|nr:uncharacterized protein ASPWEDRAFT_41050 [Aspergillus wentii DTO 134E9]OJJ35807.1 hypothetical protein ASPWEDRAFT_41050 [Aspergillus wentii DTO 134E9]